MIAQGESALQPLGRVGSNHYSYTAKNVREKFSAFFNSEEGSLPWQLNREKLWKNTL